MDYVEAAEAIDGEFDQRFDLARIANVGFAKGPRRSELLGDLMTRGLIDVGDDDPCSLGSE